MDYSSQSGTIKNQLSGVNDSVSNINGIDFDSVWSGEVHDQLVTTLNKAINDVNTTKENVEKYTEALELLQQYKEIVEKIEALEAELASIPEYEAGIFGVTDAINAIRRASIEAQINELTTKKTELYNKVLTALSSCIEISPEEVNAPSYTNTALFDYTIDPNSLVVKYLTLGPGNVYHGSLYNLYNKTDANGNVIEGSGRQYVNSILASIENTYSGREAVVNSVLASLQLAADKGVKLQYTNSGANTGTIPYNTDEQMADGMDCCAYVSWALNKGTAKPFHWEGVTALANMGEEISYSEALPGDIFVIDETNDGGRGHVGIIIENNPETETFIIADASGAGSVAISEVSYATFQQESAGGFKVRSYEDYYTGAKNNVGPYDN